VDSLLVGERKEIDRGFAEQVLLHLLLLTHFHLIVQLARKVQFLLVENMMFLLGHICQGFFNLRNYIEFLFFF